MTTFKINPELSIYIPRVFENITEDRIKEVFQSLDIGDVSRVDFVERPENGVDQYTTYMAFIHFNTWYDNITTEHLQERIIDHELEARLVYDDPYYWLLLPNTNPRTENELLLEDKLNCQLAMIQDLQARIHMLESTLSDCVEHLDGDSSEAYRPDHCGICLTETDDNRDDCGACLAPLPPPPLPRKLVEMLTTNNLPDDLPFLQAVEEGRGELIDEIENYKSTLKPSKHKILYLYRGPQGVGKDTAADEKIMADGMGEKYSTDDYFYVDGSQSKEYVWSPDKLQEAHKWNHNRTLDAMKNDKGPIHVPNTFAQAWEMKWYVENAMKYGYKIEITELFSDNIDYLFKNNIHNVPRDVIQWTCDKFERNLSVQDILDATYPDTKLEPEQATSEPDQTTSDTQASGRWNWFG